jgi:RES domain-containing protein
MIVYRIVKEAYTSLDGKGAAANPGRWNRERIPCLYTSESPSLAQLEIMVNIDDWRIFAVQKFLILEIEIRGDKIKHFKESDLPVGWDSHMIHVNTQEFGSNLFLTESKLIGFSVPSAVNKLERNFILNPNAGDFKELVVCKKQLLFNLDARLIKGKR